VDPYRHPGETSAPPTPPKRPGWFAYGDILFGLLVAISVAAAILMLALSR